MSEAYESLKECGLYFLLTKNGDFPAGRPFGSLYEFDGEIYFNTTDNNEVHKQLRANREVQLVAMKPGSFNWVRVTGYADETDSTEIKEKILEALGERGEALRKIGFKHFLVYKLTPVSVERK